MLGRLASNLGLRIAKKGGLCGRGETNGHHGKDISLWPSRRDGVSNPDWWKLLYAKKTNLQFCF